LSLRDKRVGAVLAQPPPAAALTFPRH
jgi:hypothetical protein